VVVELAHRDPIEERTDRLWSGSAQNGKCLRVRFYFVPARSYQLAPI